MIAYEELLEKLRENADVSFREFNAKICVLPLDRTLGVRVPALRKISKEYAALGKDELDILCRFPDDLFDVTFVKCLAVAYAKLTFEELFGISGYRCAAYRQLGDRDCFTSTLKSLRKRREEFLFYIEKALATSGSMCSVSRTFVFSTIIRYPNILKKNSRSWNARTVPNITCTWQWRGCLRRSSSRATAKVLNFCGQRSSYKNAE